MRFSTFFDSYRWVRDKSPVENLGPTARVAICADLGLGDGRKDDQAWRRHELLEAVLGSVYLPEARTLVLAGDTENLRAFWHKDIEAAWSRLYTILDGFQARGCLRKLLGERDLGLLRKKAPRYPLHHGLRLAFQDLELFVLHGHLATRYFAGTDYADFLQRQIDKPFPIRDEGDLDDPGRLLRAESRLARASEKLGIVTIFGHSGRCLFRSRTEYDELRGSIEDLISRASQGSDGSLVDSLLSRYRQEILRMERQGRDPELSLQRTSPLPLAPCLFNPGPVLGRKGLDFLELTEGNLRQVRWLPSRALRDGKHPGLRAEAFPELGLARLVLREASLESLRTGIRKAPELEKAF